MGRQMIMGGSVGCGNERKGLIMPKCYPACRRGKFGYIDANGHELSDFIHRFASRFSENLAFVGIDNSDISICINESMIHCFASEYCCFGFHDKLCRITALPWRDPKGYGFIDTSGNTVIDLVFRNTSNFSNGRAIAWYSEKKVSLYDCPCGIIDKNGNFVSDLTFSYINEFPDNYTITTFKDKNKKWGFINIDGDVVLKPQFEYARKPLFGFFPVAMNKKFGIVDINGDEIIPFVYEDISIENSLEFIAAERGGKWGLINQKNAVVVDFRFDAICKMQEGMAAFGVNNEEDDENMKWGYVDSLGSVVIAPQFSWGGEFNGGIAMIRLGDVANMNNVKEGYIDKTGHYIWEPQGA